MSCTEIYAFDKKGTAYLFGEVNNSWRGGMAIWKMLEEKYLPPYRPSYIPTHIKDDQVENYCRYKPTRCSDVLSEKNPIKEIWDLFYNPDVSALEKMVLGTTFDNVIVKKEDIKSIIDAFNSFEGDTTNLKEQAEILLKALNNDEITAIAWNQTSINCGVWEMPKPFKKGEHEDWDENDADENGICEIYVDYNLNEGTKHWFLMNEIPSDEIIK